jgi:hypothetical protein
METQDHTTIITCAACAARWRGRIAQANVHTYTIADEDSICPACKAPMRALGIAKPTTAHETA